MEFEVRADLWAVFLQTIQLPKFFATSLVTSIARYFILLDAVVNVIVFFFVFFFKQQKNPTILTELLLYARLCSKCFTNTNFILLTTLIRYFVGNWAVWLPSPYSEPAIWLLSELSLRSFLGITYLPLRTAIPSHRPLHIHI